MASKEAQIIDELYREWADKLRLNPEMDLDALRELFDGWGDLTAEPEGVEFKEATIADVPGVWATPEGADKSRAVLCCHGGGFVVGSSKSHRKMYGHLAKALGCPTFTLDYTRAPENPHPGIVEQAVAVYARLLEQGFQPENIGTTGDSAGGNLSAAMILYARHKGLPKPAACAPISPWFDMEGKGESLKTNVEKDLLVNLDTLNGMSAAFLSGENSSPQDPFANPLYGDLKGFPPTLVQVGAYEALLSDSERFVELARTAGVEVELQVYPEMQHVFHFMAGSAPEADDAIQKIADFMRPKLGLE